MLCVYDVHFFKNDKLLVSEMANAKLTLRPTKEIIELAHRLAEEDNTSITQMFSAYILSRNRQKYKKVNFAIGPLTRSVTGIVKVPDDWDYKKEMESIFDAHYVPLNGRQLQ